MGENEGNDQPDNTLRKVGKLFGQIGWNKKFTELDEQDYLKFIANMSIDCANNVEYSQWNNELIFKMLEKSPKMFVTFLSRFSTKTKIALFNTWLLKHETKFKLRD